VDTDNGYQLLQDVDGDSPEGVSDRSSSVHHRVLKMRSMAGPLESTTGGIGSVHHQG
jgi:hypothetical protein